MISKELNIGRAGQHLVLADLLLNGHQAFATAEGMGYDVVADCDGRLIRLQVKTTQKVKILRDRLKPIYFFYIKRCGKNGKNSYRVGDFDGFALVALDRREVFYLKFDHKIATASICVRNKEIKYTGRAGSFSGFYFQDMTLANFLKS